MSTFTLSFSCLRLLVATFRYTKKFASPENRTQVFWTTTRGTNHYTRPAIHISRILYTQPYTNFQFVYFLKILLFINTYRGHQHVSLKGNVY